RVYLDKIDGAALSDPVEFTWRSKSGCADTFPNYQLQVLRLYNIGPTLTDESEIKAVVDWGQALTVETGSGRRSIRLTLAEGTGYYLWRVHPIGSWYDGGIANDSNWGQWSPSAATGD